MQLIDREALKRAIDNGANFTLINVLSEEQFRKEHIEGSQNVPVVSPDFEKKVEWLTGARDKPLVVYCASAECTASKEAAEKLEKAGFEKVRAYEGGMKEWKEAGYPVEGSA